MMFSTRCCSSLLLSWQQRKRQQRKRLQHQCGSSYFGLEKAEQRRIKLKMLLYAPKITDATFVCYHTVLKMFDRHLNHKCERYRACENRPCECKLHQVIPSLISSIQNVVSHFHKLQKKAH